MSRLKAVITDARHTLGDIRAERWSDYRLLSLCSDGQAQIAKETKVLKGTFMLGLVNNKFLYKLPKNVYLIERASFQNSVIDLVTYDGMDQYLANQQNYPRQRIPQEYRMGTFIDTPRAAWEDDTADQISALVYDLRNMDAIRVYPTPIDQAETQYDIVTEDSPPFFGSDGLGVTVELREYTFNSPFGVVTAIYDPTKGPTEFNSLFGVIGDIADSDSQVRIQYVKLPEKLTGMHDEIEIPCTYDKALAFYIAAMAFDDDVDTTSQPKSQKAFSNYLRELEIAASSYRRNGVSSPAVNKGSYRGAFSD